MGISYRLIIEWAICSTQMGRAFLTPIFFFSALSLSKIKKKELYIIFLVLSPILFIRVSTRFLFIYFKESKMMRKDTVEYDLFMSRIIFLPDHLTVESVLPLQMQLLALNQSDDKKDIQIYINCYGGSVDAGLALIDTMRHIKNDIVTVVTGTACSMGAVIASCGTKGKRFIQPNSRMMLHQVGTWMAGTLPDLTVEYEEVQRINQALMQILAENTDHTAKEIEEDTQRDLWFNSEEAIEYGLVDSILVPQRRATANTQTAKPATRTSRAKAK